MLWDAMPNSLALSILNNKVVSSEKVQHLLSQMTFSLQALSQLEKEIKKGTNNQLLRRLWSVLNGCVTDYYQAMSELLQKLEEDKEKAETSEYVILIIRKLEVDLKRRRKRRKLKEKTRHKPIPLKKLIPDTSEKQDNTEAGNQFKGGLEKDNQKKSPTATKRRKISRPEYGHPGPDQRDCWEKDLRDRLDKAEAKERKGYRLIIKNFPPSMGRSEIIPCSSEKVKYIVLR